MAKILFRLGRTCYLNGWKVIAAWLIVLMAAAGAAAWLAKPLTSEFAISGTPSINAIHLLEEKFPGAGKSINAATVNIVFEDKEGLNTPENVAIMKQVVAYIHENMPDLGDTTRFGNPLEVSPALQETVYQQLIARGMAEETARADAHNLRMVSDDGTIAYTTFTIDVASAHAVEPQHRQVINEAIALGSELGLRTEAGGGGFADPIRVKSTSEVVGLAVAFIVMIITFGSVVAAFMPVITALVGIGLGSLLLFVGTHWIELNNITPVLAVMIGLAVGIDYSLFILSRYRAEEARLPREDAAGLAVGTAGSSVLFAGTVVIVALAALVVVNIEFLSWMGLAAAMTVTLAVAVALTLTPALLGVFGKRAFAWKIPGVAGNTRLSTGRHAWRETLGSSWIRLVHKAPALIIAVVVLGLSALTIPVSRLEMALPSDSTSGYETTQRQSAELLAEGFGRGQGAPFLVVVDADTINPEAEALKPLIKAQTAGKPGADPVAAARTASFMYTVNNLQTVNGVRHAQFLGVNEDGTGAQILVTPTGGPADQVTVETAHALRSELHQIADATGVEVGLTGLTAVQMDMTERLSAAMLPYLLIVVGLAIVLLIVVFRSIMVPVVAGLGFLLSVGAAFGLTIMVWQEGLWGLVKTPAPLISFMPIFLIGVTFGLAMDYQVFLVTRMREHYTKNGGRDNPARLYNAVEESVIVGFSQGARVVTAAAIIMIAVFIAFIDQPLAFIQIFGFSLGVAVFFDAFFVRMALVPAAMFLLGRATWWMPRWLDRILPKIDIEGEALEKEFAERAKEKNSGERISAQL